MKVAPLASLALAGLALAAPGLAKPPLVSPPPPATKPVSSVSVPEGGGRTALGVRVDRDGVSVRACDSGSCEAYGGERLTPSGGPAPDFPMGRVHSVTLTGGHTIARVDVPEAGQGSSSSWVALVAAPPVGKDAPVVIWSGWTRLSRGEHGEEHSFEVVEEPGPKGARVLVGERRADVTVCGRPALVAARAVDPAKMELVRGASAPSLGEEERARAPKIAAERVKGEAPAAGVRALRATAASSAFEKRLAALTDGDPATAWSENKAGEGRGEFVTMSAPEEVGITGLDVTVRPTSDVPQGAAPKRFYLATPDAAFEVSMPEDAWQKPAGTRYAVKLPGEIHTSCLAVVLDEAFSRGDPRVTIAEIEARTAFDGMTPEALAGALAGGGAKARAAAAMLVRGGTPGVAAAIAAYDKLDEPGRQLAATVVDAAPCRDQVPFFAARFAAATAEDRPKPAPGEIDPELAHARDRLRRCGHASAAALVDLVTKSTPRTEILAAEELAALAPAEAVPAILDAIGRAADPTRRDLRAALARASASPRAAGALGEALAPAALAARPEIVALDLLRAVGPALPRIDGGAAAFAAQAGRGTSFRARFLLQAPAAELARAGDAAAVTFLQRSLRADDDAHVRARAAEVAGIVPSLAGALAEALGDADPRVREAALNSVADAASRGGSASSVPVGALRLRLARDEWTFVRAGAARTLGSLPADAETDRALSAALSDTSVDVRSRALDGLGAHHATAHADAIRARQDDAAENLEVRAHAMLALAALCDARSLADWTRRARLARQPLNDEDRRLGTTAVAALGVLHPADIADRLRSLLDADAPPAAREAARIAIAGPGGCPAR